MILIRILFSAQILVKSVVLLTWAKHLLTSTVKWHENNVVWIYAKEWEALIKFFPQLQKTFQNALRLSVLVELLPSCNSNEISMPQPSYILFVCCNNRAFKEESIKMKTFWVNIYLVLFFLSANKEQIFLTFPFHSCTFTGTKNIANSNLAIELLEYFL